MDRKDKYTIAVFVGILLILLFNIVFSIYEYIDYENRKESGNQKWQQVENMILQIDERVKQLEEDIDKWKK